MATVAWLPDAAADVTVTNDSAMSANVVLIGDSYSAGNGACADGEYDPKSDPADPAWRCSKRNWARLYVDWLLSQGVHATLTNRSAAR
ncbi:MAG: hypothetical protein LBR32_03365 [Propionibacteriaceae bacterium]|nr:hypothetical protein [Propionibacteriaceae bacterium]